MTAAHPVEIERKFLVRHPPPLDGLAATAIAQGYLTSAGDSVEIRVRRKGDASFLTLKSDGGLVRHEYEIAISAAQFDTLWPATHGRRIVKTRHVGLLPDGMAFELDVFSGDLAPLCMVEVEFASAAAAADFAPPDWFGDEVTEDRRYKNKSLADAGLPDVRDTETE